MFISQKKKLFLERSFLLYIVVDYQRDIYYIPNRYITTARTLKEASLEWKRLTEEYRNAYKCKVIVKHASLLKKIEKIWLNHDLEFTSHYGEFMIR